MVQRQERVLKVLGQDPDINHVVGFVGAGGGNTGNTGTFFIELKSGKRAKADEIITRLRPKLAQVDGITMFLQASQDVRVGGRASRTQYQYTLQDSNLEELREWGPKVMDRLRKVPQLKDVNTDQQSAGLELDLDLDRDSASRLGITPTDLDAALYDAFGQRQVATTFASMNQYRVVLEVLPHLQQGPESVEKLYLRSASGGMVPVSSITHRRESNTRALDQPPGSIPRHDALVQSLARRLARASGDAVHKAESEIGMPASMHASFQGTAQAFKDSLSTQPLLIAAALVTVYIVLGMLYESLVHPITILSTLPSAGVGALVTLLVFKTELSIIALIGIILLIGIVKKNAIMMIDFAIEAERDEGLSPKSRSRRRASCASARS